MKGTGEGRGNAVVGVINDCVFRLPSPPRMAMHWYLDKGIMCLSSDSTLLIGSTCGYPSVEAP